MAEQPAVALVREAFELAASGDVDAMFELWAPDFAYHGVDAEGRISSVQGREELVAVMASGERMLASHENRLVELRAVGSELVVAFVHVSAVARNTGVTQDADYVLVVHVRDGRLTWACDFIDSSIQEFLDRAWS